jgi:aspartate/methionine/tyrosine aminotransferase
MFHPSSRSDVAPFVVMDVMQAAAERAAASKEVLHLEVGQPGTGAPAPVLAAAERALRDDKLGYTVALGIPALREAIAGHYARTYRVDVDPGRIVVTPGSSGAFVLSFLAAFDKGARVAVPAPGYPCYRNILKALDLEPVDVPVDASTNHLVMPEHLERLDRPVSGLVVSSPGNPTGTMYRPQELLHLVRYCDERGIHLVSDEIYHGITFERAAATALEFTDSASVVNSFSKYFSMTGWRIGWLVVPSEAVRRVERLMQNLFIATATLSQVAAVKAFDGREELEGHVASYRRKRDVLLASLRRAGLDDIASPDGAFYLYADIASWTDDSPAFCRRILHDIGVAVTPGVDFDPLRGRRTMRFSYAADEATIAEAGRRLVSWFADQPRLHPNR